MKLSDLSIHAWLIENGVKNEKNDFIEFKDHRFLFDIYSDFSPKLCVLKAAQVGMTTCEVLKLLWAVKNKNIDAIYILPTDSDVGTMVGSKVNRIIAQNPILHEWIKDKDSIEQKQIGDNYVHFRGSWSQKQAIMVTSDWNLYDEVDSSKQNVIEQYSARLQHSKLKYEHFFSHPSVPGFGIDRYWQKSDQKHWLIKCNNGHEQYMSWPESFDLEKEIYICKICKIELTDNDRRKGRWAKRKDKKNAEFSGYWIPLFICPWVSAKDIIRYYREKTEEYFMNQVCGLPYIGRGNKLTWEMFAQNLTSEILTPRDEDPIVIGIDTGLKLDYVMGGIEGLFYHGEAKDYNELNRQMDRWKKAIAIIDAGGDLIGSRQFKEHWPGRVYLCFLANDRKTEELVQWGRKEEYFTNRADRDRMIQLVVDEFSDKRIKVQGKEEDWYDYWTDWNNLTRIKIEDPQTLQSKGYKWIRSGRDHRALATIFWRVGMMRFGYDKASFLGEDNFLKGLPVASTIQANQTIQALTPNGQDIIQATFQQLSKEENSDDWRDNV